MKTDTLFKKYALIFSALIGLGLLLSGLLNIYFSYQENRRALFILQSERAQSAANRIGDTLFDAERMLALTAVKAGSPNAMAMRRAEIDLLRQSREFTEIVLMDRQGKELLRVSRSAQDQLDSGRDHSKEPYFNQVLAGRPYRSPVYVRDGSALYMSVALAVGPPEAGITVAEIDLEFLLDSITRIKVGEFGHAYVVDAQGRLIAHPDLGLVLKETNLASLPQVQAAIGHASPETSLLPSARGADGAPVLSAFGSIEPLGWYVFVEEPLSEAYRQLYANAWRSAALMLAGMLLTLLVCVIVVRRMTQPIQSLQQGAALIGRSALEHRIADVRTGDELETLAHEFNRMAEQLQRSHHDLEQKVADRTRELEAANRQLAALSSTDALTGIANRRRFDAVLSEEWGRCARAGQTLALGMLDVDWFKAYNDHYGHLAGDACLRRLAQVLAQEVCRSTDLVARYGGEEFVFIAPGADEPSALNMAQNICQSVLALDLPHASSQLGVVSVSLGVAAANPKAGDDPQQLIQAADEALYLAKSQGRNQAVLATGSRLDQMKNDVVSFQEKRMTLVWDHRYELGHEKIDAEHRIFLGLIVEFQKLADRRVSREKLVRTLKEICKYAEFHFLSEENMMADCSYPEQAQHAALHRQLQAEVGQKLFQFAAGRIEPSAVFEFLFEWFALHTSTEDKRLVSHIGM